MLPPPLLPPPPAKPELEPQRVSAPPGPRSRLPRPAGREATSSPPAVAARGLPTRARRSAPPFLPPRARVPAEGPAPYSGASLAALLGFRVCCARPSPALLCRGARLAGKGGALLPAPRAPRCPGDRQECVFAISLAAHVALQTDSSPAPADSMQTPSRWTPVSWYFEVRGAAHPQRFSLWLRTHS